jgi:hypothetical protein
VAVAVIVVVVAIAINLICGEILRRGSGEPNSAVLFSIKIHEFVVIAGHENKSVARIERNCSHAVERQIRNNPFIHLCPVSSRL